MWLVQVLNDNVNTPNGVVYALHRIVGLAVGDSWHQMIRIHELGQAEVGRFASQADAELLAARLQVFGLHATVGQA